jgi:hypothetical protein
MDWAPGIFSWHESAKVPPREIDLLLAAASSLIGTEMRHEVKPKSMVGGDLI